MEKRIKVWDELRGVAILFMIFVHFFYYKSDIYYKLSPIQIFYAVSPIEFLKGFINLNTSYLAPFLFFFIVGIISHLKFTRQKGPDYLAAFKRFLKLYASSTVLILIFAYKNNAITDINYFMLPLETINSHSILMVIAYVYLVNEFILHSIFKYYNQKLSSKIIFIFIFSLLIIIFNIKTKTIYSTYQALPLILIVLSGCFTALLGDLFLSINNRENRMRMKFFLLYYAVIPTIICVTALIIIKPSMGSIKEMNIIYFMYCFSLSVVIIELLNVDYRSVVSAKIKKILSLLGRHSLELYIFHFFIGYTVEKYILIKFIPPRFWGINIFMVFISCVGMALLFDIYDNKIKFALNTQKILSTETRDSE